MAVAEVETHEPGQHPEEGLTHPVTSTGLSLHENLFGSSFFVLTGFHGAHVTIGILMLLSLFTLSARGKLAENRVETVELIGLYWHFVDVVWIVIFTVIYLIPK